jgi:hypothetical protein
LLTEAEKPEVVMIERMVMGSEEFTREITDGSVLLDRLEGEWEGRGWRGGG